ncbi:TPA: hypothetical protein N0F65_007888 [Lagenidium giganteum]|uniref:Leucine-rich repeat domain, L domain-like n=1 Tax=Lagenidium giganteum TaxID=4803 RepID=A0AAV2Z3V6_9STRA|nr:TPA: hypothetical protein N0F65_007888 [Lagenidium giganteum]
MDSPELSYVAGLFVPADNRHFVAYGSVLMLLALLHRLSLFRMTMVSVNERALLFRAREVKKAASRARSVIWSATSIVAPSERLVGQEYRFVMFRKVMKCLWKALTTDWISIRSPHFHTYFLTREVVEIVLQASQAYKASALVARAWLVDLFVGAMVLNCWSTPVVAAWFARRHRVSEPKESYEKAVVLALNIVFQIICCMMFPAVIFLNYYPKYELQTHGFSVDTYYDDATFVGLVLEGQMVAPTTIFDFVSKLLPHWSIYSSVNQVSQCIVRRQQMHAEAPSTKPTLTQPNSSTVWVPMFERRQRMSVVVHRLMILCGIVVTGVHLHARLRVWSLDMRGCRKPLNPWGSSAFPCAVFHVDCRRNSDGSSSDRDFVELNRESLQALAFVHCPALRAPPVIRDFRNLQGVNIYNSTLVAWDVESAFDVATQLQLTYVSFADVNFTTFPPALLDTALPPTLNDMEFSHTNLTTLPSNVTEVWSSLVILFVEFSDLQVIPPTLLQTNLYWLSLIGNNISNINYQSNARIDGNTNVDAVPTWATHEHFNGELQMYGTPYCEQKSPPDGDVATCVVQPIGLFGMYQYSFVKQLYAADGI